MSHAIRVVVGPGRGVSAMSPTFFREGMDAPLVICWKTRKWAHSYNSCFNCSIISDNLCTNSGIQSENAKTCRSAINIQTRATFFIPSNTAFVCLLATNDRIFMKMSLIMYVDKEKWLDCGIIRLWIMKIRKLFAALFIYSGRATPNVIWGRQLKTWRIFWNNLTPLLRWCRHCLFTTGNRPHPPSHCHCLRWYWNSP